LRDDGPPEQQEPGRPDNQDETQEGLQALTRPPVHSQRPADGQSDEEEPHDGVIDEGHLLRCKGDSRWR